MPTLRAASPPRVDAVSERVAAAALCAQAYDEQLRAAESEREARAQALCGVMRGAWRSSAR